MAARDAPEIRMMSANGFARVDLVDLKDGYGVLTRLGTVPDR
jgi:hypothetical protein